MILKKKVLNGLVFSSILIAAIFVLISNTPKTKNLLKDVYTNLQSGNSVEQTGPNLRLSIWKYSIEVIKENPVFGVGTGDAIAELKKKYIKYNFTWGIIWPYDAHNDYLQTAICFGTIGLIVFLMLLGKPFFQSLKERKLLLSFFLLMFCVAMLSECFLDNQKGIVFFSIFYNLLIYHYLPKNLEEPSH
jgi:O-antigen ligase